MLKSNEKGMSITHFGENSNRVTVFSPSLLLIVKDACSGLAFFFTIRYLEVSYCETKRVAAITDRQRSRVKISAILRETKLEDVGCHLV